MKNLTTVKHALAICFCLSLSLSAKAHLMVAQHGTLNLVGDDVFMVLSLPISAFEGIDDDNDNKLSMTEFNKHQSVISKAIKERVTLSDNNGARPLQGLMLSPVVSHGSPGEPATQLIVMGRYGLTDAASKLHYHFDLFGAAAEEQLMEITATRRSDKRKAVVKITPITTAVDLFSVGD